MQLIVDSDTDISIQTKMSTIQHESLNEKFINTSLDQNICSNKCANQEIVKVCEENIKNVDQAAHQIEISENPIINETSEDKFEGLRILDNKSADVENGETINIHNSHVENKELAKENINSAIEIKLNNRIEESTETEINNIEYKKDSEINSNAEPSCRLGEVEVKEGVPENTVENQVEETTEDDQVRSQSATYTHIFKDKIEEPIAPAINNILKQVEKLNEETIEMDVTVEEQGKDKVSVLNDKNEELITLEIKNTLEQVEVVNKTEGQIEKLKQQNIEMDVTLEEQDRNKVIATNNKLENLSKDNVEKENQENIEIDVTFEKQDEENTSQIDKIDVISGVEDISASSNAECMDVDVTMEEQDNVNMSVTSDHFEEQGKVTNMIEDKFEKQHENSVDVSITAKEDTDTDPIILTEDKVKEYSKVDSEIVATLEEVNKISQEKEKEEIGEIDVSFEEHDMADDVIKKGNKDNSALDVLLQERNKAASILKESKSKEEIIVDSEQKNVDADHVKFNSEKVNNTEHGNDKHNIMFDTVEHGKDNSDVKNLDVTIGTENKTETDDAVEEQVKFKTNLKVDKELQSADECTLTQVIDKLDELRDLNNTVMENKLKQFDDIINIRKQNEDEVEIYLTIEDQDKNKINDVADKSKEPLQEISSIVKQHENEDKADSQVKGNISDKHRNEGDNKKQENTIGTDNHYVLQTNEECDISQKIEENKNNEINITTGDVGNVTNIDYEKNIEKEGQDIEMQFSNEEDSLNINKASDMSTVSQMDTDEIIDIADEKDETDQDESDNAEKIDLAVETSKDVLENDTPVIQGIAPNEQMDLKKPVAETIEDKRQLTHISKLSNTLDILSDEEEDLPKETIPSSSDKECTSINIDDDDDIMLIDEESNPKEDKNKTDSISLSENDVTLKDENKVELKDEEQVIAENKKGIVSTDTIQETEAVPNTIDTKTSEHKSEFITKEETPEPKKPLVKLNFLKTFKKKLADMTRDELEEFCILKIVESVVDRSNLSEIKSQLKSLTQNIEEYKKKASVLSKQNRDLQVVLKSVQEEQKKKTNIPITPLKITRSVGMQVLMTDKVGGRKKLQNLNTTKNNVASNNGSNKQGKSVQNQTRLQKILTNTSNTPPAIPVPRLVPALNNTNLSNMKIQPPLPNTPGKSQVTGTVNNSPNQSMPNGLPGMPPTPAAQKPEKRSHSRMQQSNSVTVDLTDDEPPAKVISKNATPPVRLVPPQNLLAPHRQPFGQNVSSPRKVYIPISGSQNTVGVRPGQTIMLKTISPQGPRQRLPTPGIAKPGQGPSTVRMQRVTSRHPAPLPESVKQYQPQNWKALPPAPELKLSKVENGIVISWKIDGYKVDVYEEIASYQLYAYQETTSPPSTALWKKIGDVKALALPMACTLTQFMAGYKYYFAVRAVDVRSRLGPFSLPGSILLLNKM